MGTIFIHTLKESVNRRIALALMVVAVFFLILQLGFTHFERDAKGELVVRRFSATATINAKTWITTEVLSEQVGLLSGLWVTLGLFAAAPLLTSYMEKGWVELLLSKGTPRWQVFAGRFLGSVALFVGTAFVMNVIAVVYFSIRAGVPLRPYFVAIGLVLVSYVSALALLALVSTAQPNSALLVIVVFLELLFTGVLRSRKDLYGFITAPWARWCLDWLYRILPKHGDLERMAINYSMGRPVEWFALWTTALFAAIATAWAMWRFEKKAF